MHVGVQRVSVAFALLVLAASGDAGCDKAAQTDCYLTFAKANSPDPGDVYRVGFALRWEVRVPGARPVVFWTTRVQDFKVGEVQVPNN